MKKKHWILVGLIMATLASYASKKGYDTLEVAEKLVAKLKSIRNLKFTATGIKMELDIAITNPSDKPLDITTGGALTVKQINVYDKSNMLIATAQPSLSQLNIVPGGTVILEGVPVETHYGTILNTILMKPSSNPNDYRVETILETMAGNVITI